MYCSEQEKSPTRARSRKALATSGTAGQLPERRIWSDKGSKPKGCGDTVDDANVKFLVIVRKGLEAERLWRPIRFFLCHMTECNGPKRA